MEQGIRVLHSGARRLPSLTSDSHTNSHLLDAARERVDRSESVKARIMTKIERLEDKLLSQD